MHDLILRGGTVIDGTGTAAHKVDVAITGSTISGVGENLGAAREEIDVSGLLVTPGWVDIHAHYDGQVTWDPAITPAGWSGTTTVVIGNCGVGFAPVRPDHHEFLIQLMEGVEDIPGTALAEGISWEWETFPEYLDALERRSFAIDIGAQVPHGAVRAYVMGEALNENEASPAQIAQMAKIVREGLEAGALGFSTSRTALHRAKDGKVVPGTYASADEVLGIGRMLAHVEHGVFQMASDYLPEEYELGWMKQLGRETGKRILYSVVQSGGDPDQWRRLLRASEEDAAEGGTLTPQIAPRPVGLLLGFESSIHPFFLHKGFTALRDLSDEERIAALRTAETREAILNNPPDLARHTGVVAMVTSGFDTMYPLGKNPDYEPAPEDSIAAIAAREGRAPQEVAYDILASDQGGNLLYLPMLGYVDGNLDATRELMRHPNTIYGLADGGAHCGMISDASIPTFLLTHWGRDRTRGERIPLEELIENQTRRTAECYGLLDRGVIAPGMKADINVIDFDKLHIHEPVLTRDLPANGKRFLQKITGYRMTICSGEVIYRDGEPTGALPGRLIRGGKRSSRAEGGGSIVSGHLTPREIPLPGRAGDPDFYLSTYDVGSGQAVVFVHGFPDLAIGWHCQLPVVAAAGYRAIAPDMRGYGGSSCPHPVSAYTMSELTGDLVALLDALNIEKAIFVGHDWGGFVSWAMPVLHPDRVAGIVGVCTPYIPFPSVAVHTASVNGEIERQYVSWFQLPDIAEQHMDQRVPAIVSRIMRTSAPLSDVYKRAIVGGKASANPFLHLDTSYDLGEPLLNDTFFQHYVDAFTKSGYRGSINWYRNIDANAATHPDVGVAPLTLPCLMLTAELDPGLRPHFADDMPSRCSDLEMHMIHNAGHWVQQEYADELNALLLSWLKRRFR